MKPGDPIPAAWLQKVAGAVLQRISVRGARVRRVGTSLAIDIDQQRQGSRIPEVYKATADESGGTVTVKQLKVDGTAIGDNITLNVLPSLPISEDDYALKARTADGEMVALGLSPDTRAVIRYDGTRSTKRYTGHIWTDAGAQGAAVQFRFPNDPGVAALLDANNYVFAWPAPTWDTDASWGAVGTYGAKYWAILSPWAAMG